MKEVLVKQNKETQDFVMQKIEEIADKVDKIEKNAIDKTAEDEKEKLKEAAAEVVKASLEEKALDSEKKVEKSSELEEKLEKIQKNNKNEAEFIEKIVKNEENLQITVENQQKPEIPLNLNEMSPNMKSAEILPQPLQDSIEKIKQAPAVLSSNLVNIVNPPVNSDLNLLEVEPQDPKIIPEDLEPLKNPNDDKEANLETRVDPIVKLIKSHEPLSYQVGEKMMKDKKLNATNQEDQKIKLDSSEFKSEMRKKREINDELFDKALNSLDKTLQNYEMHSMMTRDLKAANEN